MSHRENNRPFDRQQWLGAFRELAIELRSGDPQRLLDATRAAWATRVLRGPVGPPFGGGAPPLDDSLLRLDPVVNLYGEIAVDGIDDPLPCKVVWVRDRDADWLDVCVPEETIEAAQVPVSGETDLAKKQKLVDRVLAHVADAIFAVVPFDLAIIGTEVSGAFSARSPETRFSIISAIEHQGNFLLSPELWDELHPTVTRIELPSGLLWVPIDPRHH
jgi:hypothetical protein